MPILSISTDLVGEVGIIPRFVRINSTDNLDTILSPNYLSSVVMNGYKIYPNDIVLISYTGSQENARAIQLGLRATRWAMFHPYVGPGPFDITLHLIYAISPATFIKLNVKDDVVALAGGGQGGPTLLNMINHITTVASPGDSVVLPGSEDSGVFITVINSGSNDCDVFPPPQYNINDGAANAPFSLPAGKTANFYLIIPTDLSSVSGKYYSILSA